jgi:general secretion pathway protein C
MLLLFSGYALANLTWTLWPKPSVSMPPVTPHKSRTTQGEPVTLERIQTMHVFGEREVTEMVPADAPDTRLSLTLRGLYVNDERPALSRAIIVDSSGQEQIYAVDDVMPCGAVLKEIHSDHVHFLRAGRYETLRLKKDELTSGSAVVKASAGEQLQALRKKLITNPQLAWQLARVEPVMQGGNLEGYRLVPASDSKLFTLAGLRPGDVVHAVNGIDTTDAANMGELLNQLTSADVLSLDIERDGSKQTVRINLAQ